MITRTRPGVTILRLSYAELAARLGRSADAARVLARRRGWQRITGNDGRVVVLVEEGELPSDSPPERPPGRPPDRDQVDQLREELLEARVAARAEGQVVELHNALADLAGRFGPGDRRAGRGAQAVVAEADRVSTPDHWPKNVHPMSYDDLGKMGVDDSHRLYWDGQEIVLTQKLKFTVAQGVLGVAVLSPRSWRASPSSRPG